MLVTYQAPLMRESWNEMLNCPGFTPVLCATMSEVSVVPDTWMSVPSTVAVVPLTRAAATVIELRGVRPSMVKFLCMRVNVLSPVEDMHALAFLLLSAAPMSWQAAP